MRKTYKDPINAWGNHVQNIFKRDMIDKLDEARIRANLRCDEYEAKVRAETAARIKAQEAARKTESDDIDPEYKPLTPETLGYPTEPPKTVTESGTRFSKKMHSWELLDINKVPVEYTKRVIDLDKLHEKMNPIVEETEEECEITDAIPGIKIKVWWQGQVRS